MGSPVSNQKKSNSDSASAIVESKAEYVSWKPISAIFNNVVISPWNLLIGGLLISKLSFQLALTSTIIGYALLSAIIYLYGSLGFKERNTTSVLIEPVFGTIGTKTFFSAILAFGQIGWFAVIVQIGGESLAVILNTKPFFGLIIYSILMILMAGLKLHHFGFIKWFINLSAIGLIGYLFYKTSGKITVPSLLSNQSSENLLWGTSIIISSLISFSSVTPDFLSQLRDKSDVKKSIFYGIFIPGILIVTAGAILFSQTDKLSIAALLGVSSLALFAHIFNVITNTDAAIAIFTPAHRFAHMFNTSFKKGLLIAGAIALPIALAGMASHLEIWLATLAGFYPSIIGVTIAYYTLHHFGLKPKKIGTIDWRSVSIILFTSTLIFIVQISLLNWVVGMTAFMLYILMTGVTINIIIGEQSK
ncbi:MAG: hypothetical protein KDD56_05615 [Bdellovibrionales bacterium]|nr:hypothetical protein [Bdellovibrionales bacterium]